MQELLNNAWLGWQRYTDHGKYIALLLAVLLFLWFRRKEEKEKIFLVYTTVVTAFCIFPVSAAFLMLYQTRFYDYEWIWNYVPVTLMIAYGGTVFLAEYWENYKKNIGKCVGVTAVIVALVFLSGNLGEKDFAVEYGSSQHQETEDVLAEIMEFAGDETLCVWAPKEIMASVRAFDGRLQLLYGRNMWDAALGAYSYEVYGEVEETLYLWMCHLEETGDLEYQKEKDAVTDPVNVLEEKETSSEGDVQQPANERLIDGVWCMEQARQAGVNCIVLPENMEEADVKMLADCLDVQPVSVGKYYCFLIGNSSALCE